MLAVGELLFTQPFSLTSLCRQTLHAGTSAGTPSPGSAWLGVRCRVEEDQRAEVRAPVLGTSVCAGAAEEQSPNISSFLLSHNLPAVLPPASSEMRGPLVLQGLLLFPMHKGIPRVQELIPFSSEDLREITRLLCYCHHPEDGGTGVRVSVCLC